MPSSLETVTENVTMSPTAGAGSLTSSASARSATAGVTVAASWSSSPASALLGVESTSGSFVAVTSAVRLPGVGPVTVAVTVA